MNRRIAFLSFAAFAVAWQPFLLAPVAGDPILEIYNASLTSYKPTAVSGIQKVRPLVDQRGVNIDGSLRLGGGPPMSLAGNPFGEPWNGNTLLSGMRLDTGTISITDVDLALPGPGFSWVIGRSYNPRQKNSSGTYINSAGYNGTNWFQLSQPEAVFYDHDGNPLVTHAEDLIYLVYGADRFIEFKRKTVTSNQFKAVNGAAGAIDVQQMDGGGVHIFDILVFTDQRGWTFFFFGFDPDVEAVVPGASGQFWKAVAPGTGGQDFVAYVGDPTNPEAALIEGYQATSGRIRKVFDPAGRQYMYTYDGNNRLTTVTATNSAQLVARVEYSYYIDSDPDGKTGDLKLVKITTPLTNDDPAFESEWLVRKKHYRYYDDPTPHLIRDIVDFEGYRRFDWQDLLLNESPPDVEGALETALKPYAAVSFEYDAERRISKAWFNGDCGCPGGSGNGEHTFTYDSNGADDPAGYDVDAWRLRTIVKRPDAVYRTSPPEPAVQSYLTQYFDETGQPLGRVETNAHPGQSPTMVLATHADRDASGRITAIHSPANITYAHSSNPPFTPGGTGLITVFDRLTTTDLVGFLQHVKWRNGTSGAQNLERSVFYQSAQQTVGIDVIVVRPLISAVTEYPLETTVPDPGPPGAPSPDVNRTSFAYDRYDEVGQPLAIEKVTTTYQAVSAGKNGSGLTTTAAAYYDRAGRMIFERTTDGIVNYWQYDQEDGRLEKTIEDADTSLPEVTQCAPVNPIPPEFQSTGTEFHVVTCYTFSDDWGGLSGPCETCPANPQGNSVTSGTGSPTAVSYTAKLKDGRIVTLGFSHWEDLAPDKYYGPVSYSITNHAGRVELDGIVKLNGDFTTVDPTAFVDETIADPITAINGIDGNPNIGNVARMTTFLFNVTGQKLEQSRLYFAIPLSGEGTATTNYDPTLYSYDAPGRIARVQEPTGSIRRSRYDSADRLTEQWLGTDDFGYDGSSTPGPVNIVRTAALAYDANSNLISQTLYLDGPGASRLTTYSFDTRGNVLLVTNPINSEPRHVLNKYDNLRRLTASALYRNGTAGPGDNPLTLAPGRLSLSQTFFDELGRVYKTQVHNINQTTGVDQDNLQSLTWYDAPGRVIKEDGSQLVKTAYDRLGRQTNQFILADVNEADSSYADADDVLGDHVLQEQQTVYESKTSSDVQMTVVIDRFHDNVTFTGALDSNADADPLKLTAANVNGRPQITAYWYDFLDRVTTTAVYGMHDPDGNGAFSAPEVFNRFGLGVPLPSDIILVTGYTYASDGSLQELKDPRERITRYAYDDAGRQTKVIRNRDTSDATETPGPDDLDQTIRYEYSKGLQSKLIADLPTGTDQETQYVYGVTTGDSPGPSKVYAGHLLRTVKYPDPLESGESDPDRQVQFAYNAQGEQIWTRDQAGNEISTEYDPAGRPTDQRVTILAGGFDGAVRRIATTYDDWGRRRLVTQHDDPTAGNIVDQVRYSYDEWGNVSLFEQDRNSAISGDDYEVSYTYSKATGGRNTVRRTFMVLPSQAMLTFEYLPTPGSLDDKASRVSQVKITASPAILLAKYMYNGPADVVGTDIPGPAIESHRYGSTSGVYPDLDRFNRVTTSRWRKNPMTCGTPPNPDFYKVGVTYDRNSNVDRVVDDVHVNNTVHRFDADYVMDGLDRLRKTQEGHWNGSAIDPLTLARQQLWQDQSGNLALDQVGNWEWARLDLDGDNVFVDLTSAKDYDDDRTHNLVNELKTRDLDGPGAGSSIPLLYDKPGNLTDDGQFYIYVYDAFGRLRQVKNRNSPPPYLVLAEYRYNGLGYRIGWHYDVNASGSATVADPWYYFVYDERWRIVETFLAEDPPTTPKERFVYHNAGFDGLGGSSYIDAVILRDRDNPPGGWGWEPPPSDGILEERRYYCQNWRNDVVAIVTDTAKQVEQVRYSSYGIPFVLPGGDADSDGDTDAADLAQINAWITAGTYDVRGDLDLNGCVNGTDRSLFRSGMIFVWGVLSRTDTLNRKGYAGYEFDPALQASYSIYHVRRRVLNADLGRWMTRDPLEYVEGTNLYEYVTSNPLAMLDPRGTDGPGVYQLVPDPFRRPYKKPRPAPSPPKFTLCGDGDSTPPPGPPPTVRPPDEDPLPPLPSYLPWLIPPSWVQPGDLAPWRPNPDDSGPIPAVMAGAVCTARPASQIATKANPALAIGALVATIIGVLEYIRALEEPIRAKPPRGDCYCYCTLMNGTFEPMGRMTRAECKSIERLSGRHKSCNCK